MVLERRVHPRFFKKDLTSIINPILMKQMDRRTFLLSSMGGFIALVPKPAENIMTVTGLIRPEQMGTSLIHEHFLVDFIGADRTGPTRWDRAAVVKKVLPYLMEAKKSGCQNPR